MKVVLNGNDGTAIKVTLDTAFLDSRVHKLVVKGDSLVSVNREGQRLGSDTLLGIIGNGVINVTESQFRGAATPMAFTVNCSLAELPDVTLDGGKFEQLLTKLREDVQRVERSPAAVNAQKPVLSLMMIHELLLSAKVRES